MRQSTTSFSFIASLLACLVAGCGGGSEEGGGSDGGQAAPAGPAKREAKIIDVSQLPPLEPNPLPVLDDGRIELSSPEGWRPMSRNMKFVARFAPDGVSGSTPPRILVTADDAPGDSPPSLTADDVAKFEAYMNPLLDQELKERGDIREPPRTLVIGDQPWSRYVLGRSFRGMPVDGQVLKTVANGRIYTMELQVDHQPNMIEYRDQAYAIAAGMKFPKVAASGEGELGGLFTGDGGEEGGGEDGAKEGGGEEEGGDDTTE